jgi:hypothetical protein
MSARSRGRLVVAALTVPILFGAVACDDEEGKAKAAASAACPAEVDGTAATPVPADVPLPSGAKAYSSSAQGKTQVWFVAVDIGSSKLPALRDDFDAQLKGKGYTIEGTDQEEDVEAESEFSGPHDGTSNFRHLCSGKAVLRLKLTS